MVHMLGYLGTSLFFAILGCLSVTLVSATTDTKCPRLSTTNMKVSVKGHRNQTGHWISEVAFKQGHGQLDAWAVDVEQTPDTCEGERGSTETIIHLTSSPTPNLPEGYELFAGLGYYKMYTEATTWPLARQRCNNDGTHLHIINSVAEEEVMKTYFTRHPDIGLYSWAGINRIEDDFYTIFGLPLSETGFTRWHPGQPNKGAEYCVAIHRQGGGYDDNFCLTKLPFVCEQSTHV